jgi:hypothetical protein
MIKKFETGSFFLFLRFYFFWILSSPKRTFYSCFTVFSLWLVTSGFLFQGFRLQVLTGVITDKTKEVLEQIHKLEVQTARYEEQDFVRKQAIESLDLANHQDLIFLFSE